MQTTKELRSVIWMRPERSGRGPEPAFTRDEIAAAAVRLADRNGMQAVTMRALAAALGTGASALYRYFDRKDDLLNLIVDSVLSARMRPSGDWREDMARMGHALRAGFHAHPWLITALAGRPTLGPNRLTAVESSLAVFDPLDLPIQERLAILDTLVSFVRGYVSAELADRTVMLASDLPADQWQRDQALYARSIVESGNYPRLSRLFEANMGRSAQDLQDANFEFGLETILNGIAAGLD